MNKRLQKHLAGYRYSLKGLKLAFLTDQNMLFHLIAAILVMITNILLHVSKTEWLITLMLVGLAWMAELFNTAIERLADRVSIKQDPLIAAAKDLASAAVFIVCLVAVIGAFIIYIPYLTG